MGDVLADTYDDMFKGVTLQDLPDLPQFVFDTHQPPNGKTGPRCPRRDSDSGPSRGPRRPRLLRLH
jgi:hypothetical protein